MAKLIKSSSNQRPTDYVTEELIQYLSSIEEPLSFDVIFQDIYKRLKTKHLSSGCKEIQRLRIHEKLQNLVSRKAVAKQNKAYSALPKMQKLIHEQSTLPRPW